MDCRLAHLMAVISEKVHLAKLIFDLLLTFQPTFRLMNFVGKLSWLVLRYAEQIPSPNLKQNTASSVELFYFRE